MNKIAAISALIMATLLSGHAVCAQERVLPSDVNFRVRQFNDPNLIYAPAATQHAVPLVVYLPGTGGRSERAPTQLLQTIRDQGYRVIFLSYDNVPAADQICPRQPPGCFVTFRSNRTFGGDSNPVPTPRPEAIAQRLGDLLRYLARQRPDQGWSAYLAPDGSPAWPRIVVSGLSQGAGMAAFIAKRFPVDRVVLFSSPWDAIGPGKRPAAWLFSPSATPPERWWAERHVRENTTQLIAHAYEALRIPSDHILLFNGGLPPGKAPDQGNPYHTSTVQLPQYVPKWRTLYGLAR